MKKETLNGATWSNRKRRDLPLCTPPMMKVLLELRAAAEADSPFIHLPGVHSRTLRSLLNRDWIFKSPGSDGTRYKVTGRGLKALKVYEPTLRRTDDICPTCGIRPKKVYPGGSKGGYCDECEREHKRKQLKLKGKQLNPDGLCPRCKERPKHKTRKGGVRSYCNVCKKELAKDERKRKHQRLLERIAAGEHIKCLKCDEPRYHTQNTVYDYCYKHYRQYMNEYNDRRRPDSKPARSRRQKAARR